MTTATYDQSPASAPRHVAPSGAPDLTVTRSRGAGGLVASDRDLQIAQQAQLRRLARTTPQLGDYVRFPGNEYRRLSVSYEEQAWQCEARPRAGSFFLHPDGSCPSPSGSMAPGVIPGISLTPTDDLRPADVWMFSNGRVEAHQDTHLTIHVRVWDHATAPDRLERTPHVHE
jgi:hypothetical protein